MLKLIFARTIIVLLMLQGPKLAAERLQYWTIGPSISIKYGTMRKWHPTFGVEFSHWPFEKYGYDVGFEFGKGHFQAYSELQFGFLVGISAGPVFHFESNNPTRMSLGPQFTLWGAGEGDLDFLNPVGILRLQMPGGQEHFQVGVFGKYFRCYSGCDF